MWSKPFILVSTSAALPLATDRTFLCKHEPFLWALKMGSLEVMLAIVQNGCYFVTHEMNLWLVYVSVCFGSSQSDLQDKWFITWRRLLLTSGSHYHPYLILSFVTYFLSFYLPLFLFSSIFSFLICLSFLLYHLGIGLS